MYITKYTWTHAVLMKEVAALAATSESEGHVSMLLFKLTSAVFLQTSLCLKQFSIKRVQQCICECMLDCLSVASSFSKIKDMLSYLWQVLTACHYFSTHSSSRICLDPCKYQHRKKASSLFLFTFKSHWVCFFERVNGFIDLINSLYSI